MAAGEAQWQLTGSGATLECGSLMGSVVLDSLNASFLVERWQGRALYGFSTLAYFGPAAAAGDLGIAETYVRGGDFVASFAEAGSDRLTPHLYWRAESFEEFKAAKIELIISLKTDLLDSRPLSRTHSLLSSEATILHASSLASPKFETLTKPLNSQSTGGGRALRLDSAASSEHLLVFRMPQHGLSYAQLVHPSDYVAAELGIDSEPPYSLLTTLFPERLEKGVIRRGRVASFFMPSEDDLDVAVELARRFVSGPLPLTT